MEGGGTFGSLHGGGGGHLQASGKAAGYAHREVGQLPVRETGDGHAGQGQLHGGQQLLLGDHRAKVGDVPARRVKSCTAG